jgi:hypothetical protein
VQELGVVCLPALGRQRQEDGEFEASLDYMARPFQKKQKQKQKQFRVLA